MKLYMKDVDGNPQQVKLLYGSKNLINVDEIVNDCFVKNADGSFTLSKINGGWERLSKWFNINLPAGTYQLSCTAVDSTSNAYFRAKYTDGTYSGNFKLPTSTVWFEKETTALQFFLSYTSTVGQYYTFKDFRLNKGTTVQPYDKYFPLSKMNLYLKSRNLIPFPYSGIKNGETKYGITFTIDENGVITANGVGIASTGGFNIVLRDYFPVATGQTFSFSSSAFKDTSDYAMYLQVYTSKGASNPIWAHELAGGRTYTIPEGYAYGRLVMHYGSGAVIENMIFKPMLSEGKTIFPFEPPQEYPN